MRTTAELCNRHKRLPRSAKTSIFLLALAAMALPAGETRAQGGEAAAFCLTVLHNNDAESQLLNAGSKIADFGGAARFVAQVRKQAEDAAKTGCAGLAEGDLTRAVVILSSGDNYLPSPELKASLEKGVPYYDSLVINAVGYDALAIGNHEFDLGPNTLARFIEGVDEKIPFVSANLDLSAEPALQALVDKGRIVKSLLVTKAGRKIGIVGATTDRLASISSPRKVTVGEIQPAVQAEIDKLSGQGADIIVLISHLQDVDQDLRLIPQLTSLDIAIAGGGDELLVSSTETPLVPGDEFDGRFGDYPEVAKNAEGHDVPVVTTAGDLKYLGRLEVAFDADGRAVAFGGAPLRIAGGSEPDAIAPDKATEDSVERPVAAFVAELGKSVVGSSEVALEGRRGQLNKTTGEVVPGIRTTETNLGSLMAAALLETAVSRSADFGLPKPDVALQNGGGIRNNTLIPAGKITALDSFDVAPFANYVSLVEAVPAAQFKEIMERAVSGAPDAAGQFAQIAGFKMTYDCGGTAQVIDKNGTLVTAGARVVEIRLDDGRALVEKGAVLAGAPAVNVATIDFLARGGDSYPYRGAPFKTLGVSYQQALQDYIETRLEGRITAADFPETFEGRRITRLNCPAIGE